MALLSAITKAVDELVQFGYPREVAERIVDGKLDMRPEAVSERRSDFTGLLNPPTYYKGGGERYRAPLIELEDRSKAFFATPDPMLANSYVESTGMVTTGGVYPLNIDTRDFATVDARGQSYQDILRPTLFDAEGYTLIDSGRMVDPRITKGYDDNAEFPYSTDHLAAAARRADIPGVLISNVVDLGPNYGSLDRAMQQTEGLRASDYIRRLDEQGSGVVAVNPDAGDGMNKVRSLFAAFDPEYKGSNILGGAATAAVGAGLLAAPEEAEAGILKAFGREFDPRFDPRAKEQEKLRDTTFTIEERGTQDAPRIPLADLEGRPFVTTQSDRTQAGGILTRINDVDLAYPVDLRGGQGFMFENPAAWASGGNVVSSLMKARDKFPGESPLLIPFRMAPTGGDFATMTGETMLSYASANMTKTGKRQLDKQIKALIPEWKGVDDPESIKQFQSAKTPIRKYIQQQVMDVNFRDDGGLSIGQARLAVTDPKQAQAGDLRIQNIGEIFAGDKTPSDHPAYPFNLPGQGLGYTDQEVNIFELMPEARVGEDQRLVADPQRPTRPDARALDMKPYTGRITEDILRGLEARGVNINANPMVTAAAVAAGQEAEGLLAQLPQKDLEAYNYSDVLPIKRSKDAEEREGLLGGYSPAYTGIVEDMVEGLLKFSTQAKRGIYNPTAATEFLL